MVTMPTVTVDFDAIFADILRNFLPMLLEL